ncbi:fatty acid cis/trans isomerase [uncultured Thiodictyon sp.]|uniref:fatty acid cis/trans isomerase n=1 Tax=uncultured Thiodictyon sp. TaxID=1846217 RepID=UPI0025F6EFDC|nr:fatty acid cis/trans isomerase [uncultured Thiodictyon sp.]
MSIRLSAWLAAILLAAEIGGIWMLADAATKPPSVPVPPVDQTTPIRYDRDIQSIFNRRCIACHGCLGSPCNLKLDSFAGVQRGGFGLNPYANHIEAYPRTDMDAAPTLAAWRQMGFYPVLADAGRPRENVDGSLIYRLLAAGTAFNQPGFSRAALTPVYANRYAYSCPSTPAALGAQLAQNPARGMPFGLPAIERKDFDTLTRWIGAGAPGPSDEERQAAERVAQPAAVARWEAFFNDPDPRHQLVSRYIFEHLYLAAIVLDEEPGAHFRLVRSSSPPGQPVTVIGTGLPYDDPYTYAGVKRFWYRLSKQTSAPVQKNLFVWRLKPNDIAHLDELFLGADAHWDASAPLDAPWGIGNPFSVFRAIPAQARYRFLLENAQAVTSGVIYGPVCLGQTATYAVKDQFWVFFLDPKADVSVQDPELGLSTWNTFMDRSIFGDAAYVDAYGKALAKLRPQGWSIDAIWDGGGQNRNAWLTVMRHQTNVSVVLGRQGGTPRTYWLMSYSGLERMYYDTVAGFKYWGGDLGKLTTLLFFNFLRQEFEDNFLLLLPPGSRAAVRHTWTQGIGSLGLDLIPFAGAAQPTGDAGDGKRSLAGLVEQIAQHLGPQIAGPADLLNPDIKPVVDLKTPIAGFDDWERAISTLTVIKGKAFTRYLPSVTLLRLKRGAQSRVYSLVVNRVFKSQFTLLFQDGEAVPDLYSLSVYPTIINGFPNLFVELDMDQAAPFLSALSAVASPADWEAFKERYAILRNSARLWPFYDWINDWNFSHRKAEAGVLDLTYYDTPE